MIRQKGRRKIKRKTGERLVSASLLKKKSASSLWRSPNNYVYSTLIYTFLKFVTANSFYCIQSIFCISVN